MFCTYILKSEKSGDYYVGSTGNLQGRLLAHNCGKLSHTKGLGPWILVYSEPFETYGKARRREHEIKSWDNPADMIKKLGLDSTQK